MIDWQPLETAPKDGTRVLLWIKPVNLAIPYAWNGREWMGDDYPLNMAWATHWMPLPPPP